MWCSGTFKLDDDIWFDIRLLPYADNGTKYVHYFGKVTQADGTIYGTKFIGLLGFAVAFLLHLCWYNVFGKKNTR